MINSLKINPPPSKKKKKKHSFAQCLPNFFGVRKRDCESSIQPSWRAAKINKKQKAVKYNY